MASIIASIGSALLGTLGGIIERKLATTIGDGAVGKGGGLLRTIGNLGKLAISGIQNSIARGRARRANRRAKRARR